MQLLQHLQDDDFYKVQSNYGHLIDGWLPSGTVTGGVTQLFFKSQINSSYFCICCIEGKMWLDIQRSSIEDANHWLDVLILVWSLFSLHSFATLLGMTIFIQFLFLYLFCKTILYIMKG